MSIVASRNAYNSYFRGASAFKMYTFGPLGAVLLGLIHSVSAHGYLKSIEVKGVSYLAWQVGQDDYLTPEPARYARRIKDNG